MSTDGSTRLRPVISRRTNRDGKFEGHEIAFERWNAYGERASGVFVFGNMSDQDIYELYARLSAYIDETMQQD